MEMTREDQNHSSKDEMQALERRRNWDGLWMVKHGRCWYPEMFSQPLLSSQKHFKAKNSDIILATMPKSGTTWLKALTFSIANRNVCTIDQSPLLTSNPHQLVPFLEFNLYVNQENPDLEGFPSPRILSTHMPFKTLPDSIGKSGCRIIYLCRNPLDQFISQWCFSHENKIEKDAVPVELSEAFDMFGEGFHHNGPFWEHVLGYWNAHLENSQKVFFLKYEDLKEDVLSQVKKIAEFIGFPFSPEEEKQGIVEEISRLCSFKNLKDLGVNKNGYVLDGLLKNNTFFRKGEVGDSTNYLTSAMIQRFKKLMENKFEGSGLMFKI